MFLKSIIGNVWLFCLFIEGSGTPGFLGSRIFCRSSVNSRLSTCSFDMVVGEFFSRLVLFIVPKYCHDEFFVNFNFFHGMFGAIDPSFHYWGIRDWILMERHLWPKIGRRCFPLAYRQIFYSLFAVIMRTQVLLFNVMYFILCAVACLKIALSKCLGYFIVALASIGK